jgi:uncharacterized protein (UPF0332 family)
MSFNWSNYLEVAQDFNRQSRNSSKQEALQRSALSRAYYSVFVTARNYLRDIRHDPNIPRAGEAHIYVASQFHNHPNPTFQEIGSALTSLRRERNKADYDDTFPNLANTVVFMLVIANDALDKLAQL